jgi:hypothetical protein
MSGHGPEAPLIPDIPEYNRFRQNLGGLIHAFLEAVTQMDKIEGTHRPAVGDGDGHGGGGHGGH